MLDASPDRIDGLIVVPDVALVKFNHDVHTPFGRILIRVLQQTQNKVLQFFIQVVVFGVFVQKFDVRYDDSVEVLAEGFVFAFE